MAPWHAILIVYYMAKSGKEVAPIKLVLVGTAVAAMFTAFSNFIVYKAPDDTKIREVTFWTLGSIASAEWEELIPMAVVLIPGGICMYALSSSMNALLMGESSAVTLGVNVNLAGVRSRFSFRQLLQVLRWQLREVSVL
ncbi:MAG: iron chelate uptake ABC transporter family permease subunit [Lachnospiraceae bacterium]